mmetsp:Transcript_35922/g.66179  ORF Transcript_35922/g.66179 Transcript_35922/m.66179 type:complete len:305 (-) Transcript_35922:571-1485(-)
MDGRSASQPRRKGVPSSLPGLRQRGLSDHGECHHPPQSGGDDDGRRQGQARRGVHGRSLAVRDRLRDRLLGALHQDLDIEQGVQESGRRLRRGHLEGPGTDSWRVAGHQRRPPPVVDARFPPRVGTVRQGFQGSVRPYHRDVRDVHVRKVPPVRHRHHRREPRRPPRGELPGLPGPRHPDGVPGIEVRRHQHGVHPSGVVHGHPHHDRGQGRSSGQVLRGGRHHLRHLHGGPSPRVHSQASGGQVRSEEGGGGTQEEPPPRRERPRRKGTVRRRGGRKRRHRPQRPPQRQEGAVPQRQHRQGRG